MHCIAKFNFSFNFFFPKGVRIDFSVQQYRHSDLHGMALGTVPPAWHISRSSFYKCVTSLLLSGGSLQLVPARKGCPTSSHIPSQVTRTNPKINSRAKCHDRRMEIHNDDVRNLYSSLILSM